MQGPVLRPPGDPRSDAAALSSYWCCSAAPLACEAFQTPAACVGSCCACACCAAGLEACWAHCANCAFANAVGASSVYKILLRSTKGGGTSKLEVFRPWVGPQDLAGFGLIQLGFCI